MSWLRSPPALMGALLALIVAIGLVATLAPQGSALILVALLLLAPVIWLLGVYWRRLDEAARAAQQSAWFWGGSIGMGVGIALLLPGFAQTWLPGDIAPNAMALVGGVVVAVSAAAGFLVAWAIWWLRRR